MNNDMDLFDDVNFDDVNLEETSNTETVKVEVQEAKTEEVKDALDVDNFFEEIGVKEEVKTKGSKKKTEKKNEDETKEPKFTGPRPVVVYGQELFIEENSEVALETIRQRIVNEFKFPEFSKDRTHMSFDKTTGIVVPVIEFKKKG